MLCAVCMLFFTSFSYIYTISLAVTGVYMVQACVSAAFLSNRRVLLHISTFHFSSSSLRFEWFMMCWVLFGWLWGHGLNHTNQSQCFQWWLLIILNDFCHHFAYLTRNNFHILTACCWCCSVENSQFGMLKVHFVCLTK